MTRAEAEALLSLADRLWMVGARRGRAHRIAHALEEWAADHPFEAEQPTLFEHPESEDAAA